MESKTKKITLEGNTVTLTENTRFIENSRVLVIEGTLPTGEPCEVRYTAALESESHGFLSSIDIDRDYTVEVLQASRVIVSSAGNSIVYQDPTIVRN